MLELNGLGPMIECTHYNYMLFVVSIEDTICSGIDMYIDPRL